MQFGSIDADRKAKSIAAGRAEARGFYEERKGSKYMSGRKEKQFWGCSPHREVLPDRMVMALLTSEAAWVTCRWAADPCQKVQESVW